MNATRKTWKLFEAVDWPTGADNVDEQAGIIKNVKILGRRSKNNRRYSDAAMDDATQIYEGLRVNVDHPDKKNRAADRPVKSRLGKFKNVQKRPDGVYGELHYLRSNPVAPMLVEACTRPGMSDVMGFSHNATVYGYKDENGCLDVESIPAAKSIDLVADPATTDGIFESEGPMADVVPVEAAPAPGKCTTKECLLEAIKMALTDSELGDPKGFMNDVLKLIDKHWGVEGETEDEGEEAPAGESDRSPGASLPLGSTRDPSPPSRLNRSRRLRKMELREEMRDLGLPVEAEIVESLLGMPPANATRQLLYLKRHARARGGPRSLTRVPPPASGGLGGSHEVSESRGSHGNHQGNAPPWGDDARMTEWLSQHS